MPADVDAVIVRIIATQKEYEKQMAAVARSAERAAKASEASFVNAGKRISTSVSTGQMEQGFKGAQQAAGQLSFQLNDIATSLTGGMSPFQIMMQQGSQVTQVMAQVKAQGGSMGQVLVGAFSSMLNPISLISMGLILAAGYAYKYFTTVEDGSSKAAQEFQKQIDVIDALTKKYDVFLSEATKEQLGDIVDDAKLAEATDKIEKAIAAIRAEAGKAFDKTLITLPEISLTGAGATEGPKLAAELQDRFDALRKSIETGEQPLERFLELLALLNDIDLAAPGSGAKQMGIDLKANVLPYLTDVVNKEKALQELRRTGTTVTEKQAESQKAFNKALKEMKDLAEPTKTEFDKMWDAYRDAVKAAHGDLLMLIKAQDALKAGLTSLETAKIVGGGVGKLIRKEEGFRADPYPDVTGLAIGYGMHQVVDASGTKRAVTAGMKMTFEEAERQLELQLPGYVKLVTDKIGTDTWNSLNESQQAALASIAWNYGKLPDSVANAIKTGDTGQVQRAIAALSSNPERRRREAELYGRDAPAGAGAALAVDDLTKSEKEQAEAEKEAAKIKGEYGAAIDEKIAKQTEELEMNKLLAEANKKAAAEGRKLTDEEIARLREIAHERGLTAGKEAATKQATTYTERLQGLKDEYTLLQQQAQQLGINTTAIDANKAAQDAANETLKITQQLQSQGITLTQAQKDAIYNSSYAIVSAKQALDGYNTSQKQVTQDQKQLAQQVSSMVGGAITGFISDLRNGVSAGDAFRNMLDRVVDSLIQMAVQMLIVKPLMTALGGGTAGTGVLGFAAGGTVGLSRHQDGRKFSPALWAGAPRYARGGVVGLRPGEFPIIAHQGEVIIPNARRVGGTQMSPNTTTTMGDVNIDMGASGFVAADNDSAKEFGKNVQKIIQIEMVRESRPGGLLRRVPS
jgi:GH24 family phage-related lysozyme (muramidase)